MLLGNGVRLGTNPQRLLGGANIHSVDRSNWGRRGAWNNMLAEAADAKYGVPNGYRHPGAWILPIKPGALASVNLLYGDATIAGGLAAGYNLGADLAGTGTITDAAMALVVSAVAALSGVGGVSADIVGVLDASADLSGTGGLTAALSALADMVAQINGTSSLVGPLTGKANISADITPFAELSPQSLATAVWNAVAANLDEPGTMARVLREIYELHGLDASKPLAVTPTSRAAGDIAQTITDAAGTVTVQRT